MSNLLEVDSENFNNLKLETNLLYQIQSKERREKGQGLNKPIAKKKHGKNQKEKIEAMEIVRKNEVQSIEGLLKFFSASNITSSSSCNSHTVSSP